MLTNNEIKDNIKVIKSLENRGIFLKGTTRQITSWEGGFFNFLDLFLKLDKKKKKMYLNH